MFLALFSVMLTWQNSTLENSILSIACLFLVCRRVSLQSYIHRSQEPSCSPQKKFTFLTFIEGCFILFSFPANLQNPFPSPLSIDISSFIEKIEAIRTQPICLYTIQSYSTLARGFTCYACLPVTTVSGQPICMQEPTVSCLLRNSDCCDQNYYI